MEFYADVLGLRLVKKTVNFDAPEAYHLYFGDEQGSPGSILTWFEFAGAAPGRAGAGMIHTIQLGVGSESALEFWVRRLADRAYTSERAGEALQFTDYDGLRFELIPAGSMNAPLRAVHPEIPAEHAIVGVEGARAYAYDREVQESLLTETLGFTFAGGGDYRLDGETTAVQLEVRRSSTGTGPSGSGDGPSHCVGLAGRGPPELAATGARRGRVRHRRP